MTTMPELTRINADLFRTPDGRFEAKRRSDLGGAWVVRSTDGTTFPEWKRGRWGWIDGEWTWTPGTWVPSRRIVVSVPSITKARHLVRRAYSEVD
jgi:hypothetical protein